MTRQLHTIMVRQLYTDTADETIVIENFFYGEKSIGGAFVSIDCVGSRYLVASSLYPHKADYYDSIPEALERMADLIRILP